MLGIFVQLIISWILLKVFEKKNLFALNILPTGNRLTDFGFGFITAAVCCAIFFLVTTTIAGTEWLLNKEYSIKKLFDGIYWVLNSVLFEELIFRGALLYILIQRIGIHKACLISAVSFGIYHWFSFNAFGNPVNMFFIFLMTGIFGLMLAYSFAITRSLYLPIALHLGWNFAQQIIFSSGPIGTQMLYKSNQNMVDGPVSILLFLFQILALPGLVYIYLKKTTVRIVILNVVD